MTTQATYDKEQAAKFLGVSPRQIERYASAGRLTPRQMEIESETDGRRRRISVYDERELEALKREREQKEETPAAGGALALQRSPAALAQLVEALAAHVAPAAPSAPAVPLADKLTLNLSEAAQFSGLSPKFLRAAIKEGRLRAHNDRRARGWNIKRADLEKYVAKL